MFTHQHTFPKYFTNRPLPSLQYKKPLHFESKIKSGCTNLSHSHHTESWRSTEGEYETTQILARSNGFVLIIWLPFTPTDWGGVASWRRIPSRPCHPPVQPPPASTPPHPCHPLPPYGLKTSSPPSPPTHGIRTFTTCSYFFKTQRTVLHSRKKIWDHSDCEMIAGMQL